MKSFITSMLHQIKEDEMDGTCSIHGRDEKCMQ
jgi:hypothetical protein